MSDVLERLDAVLEARQAASPETSYVAQLLAQGREAILRKLGEEAVETIIAGSADDDRALLHETADLWFHSLVMLADRGFTSRDVLAELERRFGVSGIQEKASRSE